MRNALNSPFHYSVEHWKKLLVVKAYKKCHYSAPWHPVTIFSCVRASLNREHQRNFYLKFERLNFVGVIFIPQGTDFTWHLRDTTLIFFSSSFWWANFPPGWTIKFYSILFASIHSWRRGLRTQSIYPFNVFVHRKKISRQLLAIKSSSD